MLNLESLFKLNYPLCIVCSGSDNKYNGCIVNTVFQITPDPPMIAVSINRKCLTHDYITSNRRFSVSVLAEDTPMEFIGRFGFRSGRDIDKLENVNYKVGQSGVAVILNNTAAVIEAEVVESIDVETHTLFIGRILECNTIDEEKIPMTYNYYRDVKGGKTPRSAATYIKKKLMETKNRSNKNMKKYECTLCGYIYDPEIGDPDNGIEPGTAFEDLPDSWVCPDCGAGKDEFEPVED